MRALVIGGNRYIGKQLVQKLVESGLKVVVLNRGNLPNVQHASVEHIKADRNNDAQMAAAFKDQYFDLIIDLICQDPIQAAKSIQLFNGKTTRYILFSSTFVYPYGASVHEEQFDPKNYPIKMDPKMGTTDMRRVTEAVFMQKAPFKMLILRVPFVFGDNDPTQRLLKLTQRIMEKQEIYFPNKNARVSVIHLNDLVKVLQHFALFPAEGIINCACETPLYVGSLIKMIETATGKTAWFSETEAKDNVTLFSIKSDWFVDTGRLRTLGLNPKSHSGWLPPLIERIAAEMYKVDFKRTS